MREANCDKMFACAFFLSYLIKKMSQVDIDELKTWSLNALRGFLNVRGKNSEGEIDELVAKYV